MVVPPLYELEQWARQQADVAIAGVTAEDLADAGLEAADLEELRAGLADRMGAIACYGACYRSIAMWH